MKLPSWISKRSAGIDGESKLREERPAADEQRIQQAMVDSIKAVSRQRQPSGRPGRFNQAKGIACLDADFHVPDTLPVELHMDCSSTASWARSASIERRGPIDNE